MSSAHPQVMCLKADDDLMARIEHCWLLDLLGEVTEVDAKRTEQYRLQSRRKRLQKKLPFAEFIESLKLDVTIRQARAEDVPRVSQLSQRTNQFNFTGWRRTEAEIQQDLHSHTVWVVELADRFGDYGLVGVMMVDDHYRLDNFLLSCRALGKGVEHRMLAHLGEHHAAVEVNFNHTERNQVAWQFLNGQLALEQLPSIVSARQLQEVRFEPDMADDTPASSQNIAAQVSRADYVRIAEQYADLEQIKAQFAPRQTGNNIDGDIEGPLADIWSGLLGLDDIDRDADFLSLGGQSLLATLVLSKVHQRWQVNLDLQDFFAAPTVRQQASLIAGRLGVSPAPEPSLPVVLDRTLSPAQQRLWFLHQLQPEDTGYHLPVAVHIESEQAIEIEDSLRQLVTRHPLLMSRVTHPELTLLDPDTFELARQPYSEQAVTDFVAEGFDLAQGPLFKACLFDKNDNEAVLVLMTHHIITDGWSSGVLLRDWQLLFKGERLPALTADYFQFSHIPPRDEDLNYWQQQLADIPQLLPLATDFVRPTNQAHRSAPGEL